MKKRIYSFFLLLVLLVALFPAATGECVSHSWGSWITTQQPTCLIVGSRIRYCQACNAAELQSITTLPHSYSPATCITLSRCLNGCNRTQGNYAPHSYSIATCTSKATCTICGHQIGTLASHKFPSTLCNVHPVCSVCGFASNGYGSQHAYSLATCLETSICSRCRATKPGDHNWIVSGTKRTCSYCGVGQLLGYEGEHEYE